jgi:hypothetical protein
MSSIVVALSPTAEQVLGDVDIAGLVISGLATRAVNSLCLTSRAVRAAVLASVRRVCMDAPLPALLQQMASLVSLHVGPGRLDPSQPQLTRLRELRLGIAVDGYGDTWDALHGISRLGRLSSLGIGFPQMRRLPGSSIQLTALSSLHLGGCRSLQQLPDTIGQLTALSSLDLGGCWSLQQLPDTIGQLTALSSLDLGSCYNLQQLPGAISQLTGLSSLRLGQCSRLQKLPCTIGQLTALRSLFLGGCDSLHQLPDTLSQLTYLTQLIIAHCSSLRPSVSSEPSPAWTRAAAAACSGCLQVWGCPQAALICAVVPAWGSCSSKGKER